MSSNDPLTIIHSDALSSLREMESESVQCCVTSPPYWGLRDYGTGEWIGGDLECDHTMAQGQRQDTERGNHNGGKPGFHGGAHTELSKRHFRGVCGKCGAERVDIQLGLEPTPEEYVARLVEVFSEVRRVLHGHGTLWLNLGDSYCGYWGDAKALAENRPSTADTNGWTSGFSMNARPKYETLKATGLKPKDLVGIPWMAAFALRSDGWYLRSEVIWAKPAPMPESVRDRPTRSHEQIFLLTKSGKYFYNQDAVRQPLRPSSIERLGQDIDSQTGSSRANGGAKSNGNIKAACFGGRLKSQINDQTRLASGNEWQQDVEQGANLRDVWTINTEAFRDAHFAVFPTEIPRRCILAGTKAGDTVLDPFAGSGTTAKVAIELGRKAIAIEPKAEYVEMIKKRCQTTIGLPLAI